MLRQETLKETTKRTYEEPDGEFLELITEGVNTITVLTRIDSEKVGGVDSPVNPGNLTVKELEEFLAQSGDLSDEEISALLEAEREGKNRATATDAIEDKLP